MNVFIRPKLFHQPKQPKAPEEAVPPQGPNASPDEQDSPTPMTPTEVFYVKVEGGVKGVMQVHKATCPALD